MSVVCRYVGSGPCEVRLTEYTRVGQKATFTEAEFRDVAAGPTGAMFLPEPEFASVGFTAVELGTWGETAERTTVSQEFTRKLCLAQEKVRLLRCGQSAA